MIRLEAHSKPDKHAGEVIDMTIEAGGAVYDLKCELRGLLLNFYKQIYSNEGPKTAMSMVNATISAIEQLMEDI